MPLASGDEVCVLVNGLGSTPAMELCIVYRRLKQLLGAAGVRIHDAEIGNYCTSMEMGGFSITLLKLDGLLRGYYDAPCYCPYYAKEGR